MPLTEIVLAGQLDRAIDLIFKSVVQSRSGCESETDFCMWRKRYWNASSQRLFLLSVLFSSSRLSIVIQESSGESGVPFMMEFSSSREAHQQYWLHIMCCSPDLSYEMICSAKY